MTATTVKVSMSEIKYLKNMGATVADVTRLNQSVHTTAGGMCRLGAVWLKGETRAIDLADMDDVRRVYGAAFVVLDDEEGAALFGLKPAKVRTPKKNKTKSAVKETAETTGDDEAKTGDKLEG